MKLQVKKLKWRQLLYCQHGDLPTTYKVYGARQWVQPLTTAWNSADQPPWKKAEHNFISLLWVSLTQRQKDCGHQKNAEDLFAGWEMLCEAVQGLVPARCTFYPFGHRNTQRTSRQESGRGTKGVSYLPERVVQPSHLPTIFLTRGIMCEKGQRVRTEGTSPHYSKAMITDMGDRKSVV